MVDGWEMGGEYFPSPDDHPLALTDRVISECGNRQTKKLFVSSQNAALVQYRVASHGQGFSLRVRYPKNPKREYLFDGWQKLNGNWLDFCDDFQVSYPLKAWTPKYELNLQIIYKVYSISIV